MSNKKSEDKKNIEEKSDAGAKKKPGAKGKLPFFMAFPVLVAIVFLPSSILLFIGMLPTFAASFAARRYARLKVITVGALNIAGCFPFLLDLWSQGHSIENALRIVTAPQVITVMYAAAAIGYMVDWSVSMIVAGILFQKGMSRQQAIKKRQGELLDRWGMEVTGQMTLDQHGFAMQQPSKIQ